MPSGNLADRMAAQHASATGDDGAVDETVDGDSEAPEVPAPEPAMPVMPFPSFKNTPTLPQQSPGNGFSSGRDSRAR